MKYSLANNEPLEINSTLFVKGLGNYTGTNSQTAQSIQTVLSNIQSKTDATISDLNNKVNQDTYAMDKEDLEMRVNSAESLAQGAQQALAFDNYSALIQYLNPGMIANSGNVLKVGQNLYIKQLNIPDLWISAFRAPDELTNYTYTTDDAFIEYINNGGWVGCYQLSRLETTKVDLTNYATKSEVTAVDTKITDIPVEKGTGANSVIQKGGGNIASNVYAFAEGVQSKATGFSSHAEGYYTTASGERSHAEGNTTQTLNQGEHAEGNYNISIQSKTIHTVGIGTADNTRKNAHEIHLDGSHYIVGIGGYTGNNSQTAGVKTVQTVISEKLDKMINISWNELESRRNNTDLIPGAQYRITDYTCTTTQENTQSAGHVFDIIVTADSENTLNENARAIQHSENDNNDYFWKSDLAAWELKYCLDNDKSRFYWADESGNGRGVIYYMKDEFGNECPYDFKNIQFARWQLSNPVGYRNDFDYNNWEDIWIRESTKFDSLKTGFYGLSSADNVFYYGYNENDDIYEYKVVYTISGSSTYCYTFGKDTDYSINGGNYGNIIKEYKSNNKIQLNNIVFLGNNCYNNTFGNNCSSNTFSNYYYYNTFGNYCSSNTFGNNCSYNTFGNDCSSISFGNYCYSNSFSNACPSISFGNSCGSNSFGNNCSNNSFGNYCSFNTFGNNCSFNSFGDNYATNTFGNNCYSISFGNDYSNNSFGNSCQYIKFVSDSDDSAFTNYYRNNHFGDGCEFILFKASETASPNNQVKNYNLSQGLQGTSSAYLTINGVRNRSFETKVAKNSAGTLKIYCEADLIL